MNPELQKYIQDALKAGSRLEDIHKALVDAGWDTKEVNTAIRKFSPNSSKHHRFPLDLGILILNIILTLVIQGVLAPKFEGSSNDYLIRVWVVATVWVSLFFCTFITIFLYRVMRSMISGWSTVLLLAVSYGASTVLGILIGLLLFFMGKLEFLRFFSNLFIRWS